MTDGPDEMEALPQGFSDEEWGRLKRKARELLPAAGGPVDASCGLEGLLEDLRVHQIELEIQNQELRETRERLESSQHYHRSLFTHVPLGYLVLDRNSVVREANLAAADIFSLRPNVLTGLRLRSFIPHSHIAAFDAAFQALVESGTSCCINLPLRPRTGVELLTRVELHVHEEGARSLVLCSIVDRTREIGTRTELEAANVRLGDEMRKTSRDLLELQEKMESDKRELGRSVQTLRAANEQLRELLDATRTHIWIMRPDGRYSFANEAHARFFGCEAGRMEGMHFRKIMDAKAAEAFSGFYGLALRDAVPFSGEVTFRSGREECVFSLHFQPQTEDGVVKHVVGTADDVTDVRMSEQLREDVDRIMRHDLKTPLGAILGIPEALLHDDNITSGQARLLELVRRAGLKMLEMINRSLDLYKMERGDYHLVRNPVDLSDVLENVVADLKGSPGFAEVPCEVRFEDRGREHAVQGDRMLLYMMLSNLVKNAFEAADGEAVSIEVSEDGADCFVTIRNAGLVPEAVRDNFFGKYCTGGKKEGLGLGTYSAYQIVRAHGGEITFESAPETGTRVAVRLPRGE